MRTTIDIPDPLFRRMKAAAALEGTSLKNLVTRFIEQGLGNRTPAPGHHPPPRSRPPVIRPPGAGSTIPALTNAELESLLTADDAETIRRE